MPRMTTAERNAIPNAEEGLMVFNTERNSLQVFRKNIGTNNDLSGWFDFKCENDIEETIGSLPSGLTLDFSDLTNNGQFFPEINGGGAAFTSSTPNGTGIGSIGPIPRNIVTGTPMVYLSYTDNNESGNLISNPVFEFVKEESVNDYNATSFAKRTKNRDNSNGDLMSINLDDYSGDFDLILVAKFNEMPTSDYSSFFSTGNSDFGFLIGSGHEVQSSCTREYFNMNFDSKGNICGGTAGRVPIDFEFHRFRVKFTNNTGGTNAKVQFFIDGNLVQTFQGSAINSAKIQRLDLFNNRQRDSYAHSSIAFLGLYPQHLSDAVFENMDKYLACKFESQP